MHTRTFATFTRQAAAVSRRTSLLTLAGAALAATAAVAKPGVGAAKKKKSGNICKKKAKQRCNSDAAACRATLLAYCESTTVPATCAALLNPCCDTCSANGFLTCLVEAAE